MSKTKKKPPPMHPDVPGIEWGRWYRQQRRMSPNDYQRVFEGPGKPDPRMVEPPTYED